MHALSHPTAIPTPAPESLAPVHQVEARRVNRAEKAPVRPAGEACQLLHLRIVEQMGRRAVLVEGVRG